MDEYDRKFQAALDEMHRAGITRNKAVPPVTRGLGKIGLKPRPPFYTPFLKNVIGYAIWFGPVWGAAMWLLIWRAQGMPAIMALVTALMAGGLFGFFMAVYHSRTRRKRGLSDWDAL